MKRFSVRVLAEIGLAGALSIVLSMFDFYRMPQGGTVNLAMLPVFVLAFRRGPAAGVATGVLAGALQMLVDPFFVHPLQVTLDYFLAWGALGLAGFLPGSIPLGILLGSAGRFVFHYISGVWYFAHFAPEGMAAWHYVSAYILSHLLPASALSAIVCMILARRLKVREKN
ncbi:MAG: energy-coupled thiamine transporter ThiT [Bacillota bacterium]|jgi:thiamine transporter